MTSLFEYFVRSNERALYKLKRERFSIFVVFFVGFVSPIFLIFIKKYVLRDEFPSIYAESIFDERLPIVAIAVTTLFALLGFVWSYLQKDLKNFYRREKDIQSVSIDLTEEDEKRILGVLEQKFANQTSNSLVSAIYREAEKRTAQYSEVSIAGSVFSDTRERLNEEIFSLKKRGALNLFLGVTITSIALFVLWRYVLLTDVTNYSNEKFLSFFLPRLSLVFLIEIFAYFFLRLYKESLREIKFFQNELTNVESKLSALQLTFPGKQMEERLCVIKNLMKTDRNTLPGLQKDIKNDQFDLSSLSDLIKTIAEVISKKDAGAA